MEKEKDLRKLAGDVVQAVFVLSNYLEETEDLMMGVEEDQKRIRQLISEALSDYPQSQIDLVFECLAEAAEMDTAEEAEEVMKDIEESEETIDEE